MIETLGREILGETLRKRHEERHTQRTKTQKAKSEAVLAAACAWCYPRAALQPYPIVKDTFEPVKPLQEICMFAIEFGNLLPVKVEQLLAKARYCIA